MIQLTPQQQAILDQPGDLKISAVAGSGKTATLLAYARAHGRNKRVLYLAFNRSVKMEAEQKFKAAGLLQVKVETAHSLAFKQLRMRSPKIVNAFKFHELADALKIRKSGDSGLRYALTSHVVRYVNLYCNHPTASLRHLNYLHYLDDKQSRDFVDRHLEEIVRLSQRMLDQMQSGKLPLTHDYYLKQFQLKEVSLPYDFLLFDEAQDASAVMLDVFRRQRGIKLLVGDPHQQIYRWRFAINAMNSLPYPTLPLSTSFRFPAAIADLAEEALLWKNKLIEKASPIQLQGIGKRPYNCVSHAVLARTNMSLIAAALGRLDEEDKTRMWFEGGFQAYTFASNGYSIHEILQLRYGSPAKIRDPLLLALGSYDALQRYVEQTGDAELAIFLQLIEIYGDGLPEQLSRLRRHTDGIQSPSEADVTFSTVHRAKGMEYDSVRLLPDFITAKKIDKQLEDPRLFDPGRLIEEINLLYVALTRSRGWLELPEGLLSKTKAPGIKTYEIQAGEAQQEFAEQKAG